MLRVRVVILLPEQGSVEVRAGFPPEDTLDPADLAAAKWCWEKNHVAGRGSDTLPGAKRLFMPMNTGRGAVGVVGIDNDEPGPILTPDQHRLLDALADQAALAIERVKLVEDVESARLIAETDRLRAALLTSISHDLRTPLASIIGSATSLVAQGDALDASTRVDLIRNIQDEAERLNRFIGNLLDMTRLESGPWRCARDPSTCRMLSAAPCAVQREFWRNIVRRCCFSRICRCSTWTRCCLSRYCSTCWTMPANTRQPHR
jgi:two-component system sensor histidine kinase KdpD